MTLSWKKKPLSCVNNKAVKTMITLLEFVQATSHLWHLILKSSVHWIPLRALSKQKQA